jgi:alanyl-tRNA synthetase
VFRRTQKVRIFLCFYEYYWDLDRNEANVQIAVVDVLNFYSKAKKPEDKARSVYVFAGSKDAGVVHGVYVSDVLEGKGVTPDAWTSVVTGTIGGKAGGKGPSRQGAGANPEKLDDAVTEAEKFITEKMKDLAI